MADATIEDLEARVEELRALENDLAAVSGAEQDLEVDLISARTALKASRFRPPAGLDGAVSAKLAATLIDRRAAGRIYDRLESDSGDASPAVKASAATVQAGLDALSDWLEAGRPRRSEAGPRTALAVLVLACGAALWAALAIHAIFFVVVALLCMPVGFLTFSGDDAGFRRLGARRRFDGTGLRPPAAWDEDAVKARAGELAAERAAQETPQPATRPDETPAAGVTLEAASVQLAGAQVQFEAALAEAGLDSEDLTPELEAWLMLLGASELTRTRLAETSARKKDLARAVNSSREGLFRALSWRGRAPADARADTETLAAAVAELRREGAAADGS